jgi:hypothetical protein
MVERVKYAFNNDTTTRTFAFKFPVVYAGEFEMDWREKSIGL